MTVVSSKQSFFDRSEGRDYWMASVDERFFDVLGVRPILGGFSEGDFERHWVQENQANAWRPVLISFRLWQVMLAGDSGAVGRTVALSERKGRTFGIRVAGVLPRDFVFPLDVGEVQPDLLTPITRDVRRSSAKEFEVIVRVPRSADLVSVRWRLLGSRCHLATPAADGSDEGHKQAVRHAESVHVDLIPVPVHLRERNRQIFAAVLGAAGFLLLLACVNVAGLVAARNIDRLRDLIVRRALGASNWTLSRAAFVEVGVLGGSGTLLALLCTVPMITCTLAVLPASMTLLKMPALDVRVLGAAVAFGTLSIAIVGVWPARIATQSSVLSLSQLSAALTPLGRRSRCFLIAVQVMLGFVLLTAGGLTVASLAAAWRNDAGYQRERTILLEVYAKRYATLTQAAEQLRAFASYLRQVPGVDDVASSTIQPIFLRRTSPSTTVIPEGWAGPIAGVASRHVSSNFFRVMSLQLLEGRWPLESEWELDQPVAVVSEKAARILWRDRTAVGRLLVAQQPNTSLAELPRVVIGVVADARFLALDEEPIGDIYLPNPMNDQRTGLFFHVRTSASAGGVLPGVVQLASTNGLRIEQATTHEKALFASVKHRALRAWLFGSLGAAALVFVSIGILGLLAMTVALRTREMGIRLALGATQAGIVRLLLKEHVASVAAGLLVGSLVSWTSVRYLQAQLYGVHAYDPVIWAAVAATLLVAAVLGTTLPALRAARTDPVRAIREVSF